MFSFLNNIELFTTFIAVAESSTLLQAAKKVKLSQATVSLRIRKLQEHFPFPLFEKRGRKIIILPTGIEFKNSIQKSLREFEDNLSAFQMRKNLNRTVPVKVGARQEVFVKLGSKLKVDFPLEFISMNSLETKSALLASAIDVAITHIRPESHEFISTPLFTDSFLFCFPKKWKLQFKLKQSQLSELIQKHNALNYGRDSRLLNDLLRHFKLETKELKPAIISEDWTVLRNFLLNGSGFGIFPKTFVDDLPPSIERLVVSENILKPLNFYYVYKAEFRHNSEIRKLGSLLTRALGLSSDSTDLLPKTLPFKSRVKPHLTSTRKLNQN